MPPLQLDAIAQKILSDYRWPGNIRQLKNVTEQISILEKNRDITPEVLLNYLPQEQNNQLPVLFKEENKGSEFTERDLLYKVLFDMKKDLTDLKKLVLDVLQNSGDKHQFAENNAQLIQRLYQEVNPSEGNESRFPVHQPYNNGNNIHDHEVIVEESLSLGEREIELIKKALDKYKGKRKNAAKELGISERTLYRKIKEYNI